MMDSRVGRSAKRTFGVLLALMMIDYADRQVVVAAFPYLTAEWGLSDLQLGALVSAVSVTVAVGALPAAMVVDRWSRVRAIALMSAVWSVASVACGVAGNYTQMLAARIGVGAGEAGYAPAGGALLAEAFPAARRASVLGAFQAAGSLGTVTGMALGSAVAAAWGWRWAFGLLALPGLVLGLLVLRVRDYPTTRRGSLNVPAAGTALLRARSAVCAVVGGALLLVVVSSLWTWLPSYLQRAYGIAPAAAGGIAALVLLAGAVGTIVGARIADRSARRGARYRLVVPAIAALVTAGLLVCGLAAVPPGAVQLVLVVAGGATATMAVGPVAAVVIDIVHRGLRATAIAVVTLTQNLAGLAVGPVLAGALADWWGLTTALVTVACLAAPAALILWWGAQAYERDRERAGFTPSPAAGSSGGGAPVPPAPRQRSRDAR